jgi:NADH-quinone oxidoreductase subunit L
VTAGIYMIARLHVVFLASPFALEVVAIVGAATALFAATIALVQTDIKKVLAYSTVSQLGFMVLALGVGAFATAIFHVMTHAFFKALLFLGAGSIIHGMGGEQDMSQMGGLREKMPITWWTFLVGTLAIAGAPGFAGFFSKDEILAHTWGTGHYALWAVGALTAGLTAFYMFRLLFLTFFGELRAAPEVAHHVHESPPVMTAPLVILAALSIVGGWVGLPDGWLWGPAFDRFLAPVTGHPAAGEHGAGVETVLMLVATLLAAGGATLAYVFYVRLPGLPYLLAWRLKPVYELLVGKYWIDELYDAVVVRPYVALSNLLWRIVDQTMIDGAVNGVATAVLVNGQLWRYVQDGNVQHYALVFLGGAIALVSYCLVR